MSKIDRHDDGVPVWQVWPGEQPVQLDDAGLLAAYAPPDCPMLRSNFVTSVDGGVTIDGLSGALGGPGDRRAFDLLRVACDAVVVGAGTLRREGYGPMRLDDGLRDLRRGQGRSPDPVLVVVSAQLDLTPTDRLFADAPVRPTVLTHARSPVDRREALSAVAEVVVFGDAAVDLAAAVAMLQARGHRHLLCEGGPRLLGALTAADLVDEVCLTVAPKLVGAGPGRMVAGPSSVVRDLSLVHVLAVGDELLLRYSRPS